MRDSDLLRDSPLPPINSCTPQMLTTSHYWIDQIENWLELNLQTEGNWGHPDKYYGADRQLNIWGLSEREEFVSTLGKHGVGEGTP